MTHVLSETQSIINSRDDASPAHVVSGTLAIVTKRGRKYFEKGSLCARNLTNLGPTNAPYMRKGGGPGRFG